jgi:hypothetical protein
MDFGLFDSIDDIPEGRGKTGMVRLIIHAPPM